VPATGTGAGSLPSRPAAPAATASTPTVLAIYKMYFGDVDTAGQSSPTAWKAYGLNIDGKVTGASSTDTCTRFAGASCIAQLDGDDGIDNALGASLVPVFIEMGDTTFSARANTAIQKGGATMLVRLDGLGSSDSYSSLPGALLRAMPATTPPRWDGTDVRDVDEATLAGGDPSSPLALMPDGYMSDRVWVSGLSTSPGLLDLLITPEAIDGGGAPPMPPIPLPLPLQHVQVTMQVAANGGSAASGRLSGVIRTSDALAWGALWSGSLSTSLCGSSAAGSLRALIEQASDIMADGTNDPGRPCDAISVGLGFYAVRVQLGNAVPEPPLVDPCADAGADAGGG
jgi:hypothetical protein